MMICSINTLCTCKPNRQMKWTALSLALSLAVIFQTLPTLASAQAEQKNWPHWRGPNNNGVSNAKSVPTKWSKSENVAWRVDLPGPAGSTPVIWGDQIFLTSANDKRELLLICFTTDGKKAWEQVISKGNRNVRVDEGNYASPSPSTDGKHVWAMMCDGTLVCFTVEGKKVWSKKLQDEYGRFSIQFGMTSTPVLDKGVLYLQLVHGVMRDRTSTSEGWVVALEAKSGKEKWKHKRKTEATMENKHSYTSPIIYRDKERAYLLVHGADYITAHDLSNGDEIWRCGGLQKARYNPFLRFVASPVCVPGMIVVPSAKNGPVLALNPNLKGDVTDKESAILWKTERDTPDVPSPVIHDGLVYLYRENGILHCLDAKTGEQHYKERTSSGRHRASPVYADGHIFLISRKGLVTVVKAGKEFEIVAQNDMKEPISASPVFTDGRIYLRTFEGLYAIGKGEK